MTTEIALYIAGSLLMFSGWIFFRLPGQRFRAFARIWRANKHLYPPAYGYRLVDQPQS